MHSLKRCQINRGPDQNKIGKTLFFSSFQIKNTLASFLHFIFGQKANVVWCHFTSFPLFHCCVSMKPCQPPLINTSKWWARVYCVEMRSKPKKQTRCSFFFSSFEMVELRGIFIIIWPDHIMAASTSLP